MRLTLLLFFSLLICTGQVFAQSDTSEFTIKVFGGADTEKPTTPTLLSASAVSPTQVDISWSTSTDNFAVGGYVLYRGSSTIATTTQTTFSDVGLSASTSYSYYVQAFDFARNYSTSSNILSVVTPNFPPPAEILPPAQSTAARVVAESVQITPGYSTTSILVSTVFPARFEIKWGRTASYELGYISSESLQRDYLTTITDLEPGTIYEYEIIGYTPFGKSSVVDRGQFKTLNELDLSAPTNVVNFSATANIGDVVLDWDLPTDTDLAYIRIVRSHLSFPTNLNEGAVVYQGIDTKSIDHDVLFRYSPVYYTAFAVDTAGNVSSGAVAVVYANQAISDGFNNILNEDGNLIPIGDDMPSEIVLVDYTMPESGDIYIIQNNTIFTFEDQQIPLNSLERFLVKIPADTITTNIKTIIVSLQDPTDHRKSYSFLLRLNKDRTAYESILAPMAVVGASKLSLTVYDFEAQLVGNYATEVQFFANKEALTTHELKSSEQTLFFWFLGIILSLLLLLLLWIILQRRDEDKRDDSQLPKRYSTDS